MHRDTRPLQQGQVVRVVAGRLIVDDEVHFVARPLEAGGEIYPLPFGPSGRQTVRADDQPVAFLEGDRSICLVCRVKPLEAGIGDMRGLRRPGAGRELQAPFVACRPFHNP